ncbi:hypothetical protein MPSEU_000408200 [Mayamaea pseudoterrestris]|nr:hypothetical protein MPSEU_000408200 [Mayamaea pseudoterrestris]
MTVKIAAVSLPAVTESQPFVMVPKDLFESIGSNKTQHQIMTHVESSDCTAPISEDESCTDDSSCDETQRRSCLRPYCPASIPIRTKFWKVLPAPEPTSRTNADETLIASSHSSPTASKPQHSVSFDKILIRNYAQTIGDNPSVSIGTPIQLDWDYEDVHSLSIDDYESCITRRRTAREMMLNYYNRRNLLQHRWGYTEAEIDAGERKVNQIKRQRNMTKALLSVSMVEDFVESACRKAKRNLIK